MTWSRSGKPRLRPVVALTGVLVAGATALPAALSSSATAAPAPERTVSLPATPGTHTVTYSGTAPFNNDQDGLVYGQLGLSDPKNACGPSNTTLNDQHYIGVTVPANVNPAYDTLVRFQISWTPPINEPLADMALYLYGPDGKLIASSDSSQDSEGVNLTLPASGVYDALVCAFQDTTPQPYTGTVTATTLLPPPFPAVPHVAGVARVAPPTYAQFEAPAGSADAAGEPSIGSNWKSGATLYTAATQEYKVAFDDRAGKSTWTLVNTDVVNPSNIISLDPIGFTDSSLGRTFVSQLLFVCSGSVYTDNDFASSQIDEGCGTGINGFDHQTFGGGPFPSGLSPLTSYPHAVYYCSQAQGLFLGDATCSRSDDGGLTFNPVVTVFGGQCTGLHGHLRVAPDGTVYLPDSACVGGRQGVGVSTNGGATWSVRTVPDSVSGQSDPSVSAGSDGTVYYGYCDGTGEPRITVSRDRGLTWSRSVAPGVPFGTHNCEFSEVIAGDGNRAAYGYLGTSTRGSTQAAAFGLSPNGKTFVGAEWHFYIATTFDRGLHWTTVDATPKDPVQRGCVWNAGGSNPCRNLADFNDITVDKTGRVIAAFADGCVGPDIDPKANCVRSSAVSANTLVDHGAIIRQESGRGLFAAFDAKLPPVVIPVKHQPPPTGAGGGGGLPATGSSPLLPALGLIVIGAAAALRRRRRNRRRAAPV